MLRKLLDGIEPFFEKGKPLHVFYRLYEAADTFFYSPKDTTRGTVHVRDMLDFKRMMTMVLIALGPCIFMALYNTGYQAFSAIVTGQGMPLDNWQSMVMTWLGYSMTQPNPNDIFACMLFGALYFVPMYAVTMAVGIAWEVLFAHVRGHEVNEGFFVTGILLPLTLPATIPLWQLALAVSFGVVLGKEVFGGTGRNFLNPALTARAFLFFAHASSVAGNEPWVTVDGYTGATPLGIAMDPNVGPSFMYKQYGWFESFLGTIPGAMGETSTLACLFGAAFLLLVGVASWRIMLSMLLGAVGTCLLFNALGSETNPAMSLGPHWHLVLGSFAFGLVFMATDPVSAAITPTGQWWFGALVGAMVLLVRVINPGFPEGVMLAILLGNVAAPLFDYYVVKAHVKRRALRTAVAK